MKRVGKMPRLIVSVGLLSWLAWRTDWARIGDALGHLRYEWWLLAVAVYFGAQLVSARRWQMLAKPMGFHAPFRRFAGLYFIGMYFNLFLPTSVGGDVVRAWSLDDNSQRRMSAFLSVFADRLNGLLVLLMVACVGVLVCPVPLPPWVPIGIWCVALCTAVGVATVSVGSGILARSESLRRVADAVRHYWLHPRVLVVTACLSVIVQLANVLLVWLIGRALGLDVPFTYCAVFVPLVTLLTMLPLSLNGMGIREGGTVLFLSAAGVDEGAALCLSVLWFFAMTTVSLCGGVAYFFGGISRRDVDANHETLRRDSDQGRDRESAAAA
jgi:uncharacterized membrane protein YbhN (UPF0104 family)